MYKLHVTVLLSMTVGYYNAITILYIIIVLNNIYRVNSKIVYNLSLNYIINIDNSCIQRVYFIFISASYENIKIFDKKTIVCLITKHNE